MDLSLSEHEAMCTLLTRSLSTTSTIPSCPPPTYTSSPSSSSSSTSSASQPPSRSASSTSTSSSTSSTSSHGSPASQSSQAYLPEPFSASFRRRVHCVIKPREVIVQQYEQSIGARKRLALDYTFR